MKLRGPTSSASRSQLTAHSSPPSLKAFVQNIRLSYFSYQQSEFLRSTGVCCHSHREGTCRRGCLDEYPIPGLSDPVVVHEEILPRCAPRFRLQTPNHIHALFQQRIEIVRMLLD